MIRLFFCSGALLAAMAVAVGAWSAHGGDLDQQQALWLEKALRYQMYHALALILTALSLSGGQASRKLAAGAGWFFLTGILLFSGSLYSLVLSLFDPGLITPAGGIALLCGWLLLLLARLFEPAAA